MRFIISAIGAALVLSTVSPTPSAAQTQPSAAMSQVYNSCVELARQRGWTESDIEGSRRELRNFVARCIQGREARAQKQQKQRR
jgi:hypothetical protein